MRLYDFIDSDMESILQAWEDFARSVETELPTQNAAGLRNHSEKILRTVASDMRTAQTAHQQSEKAQGRGPQKSGETAAQTHAVTRLIAGFSMDQMVSEYRALRSSVLSLWLAQETFRDGHHVQDMIRFNEAIDQALVESIAAYGAAVESTRKMVLAVLGHDLRSPLGAVLMAGDLILRQDESGEKVKLLASQVCNSARRANSMVNDLLDLARCNLGTGIPVHLQQVELNSICRSVIDELRSAFPQARIVLEEDVPIIGQFDPERMAQVFSNLIGNALRHGDSTRPIHVSLVNLAGVPYASVHNSGEPIPEEVKPYLFKPEGRYSSYAEGDRSSSAGLGLGLFIAAEIVASHGGRIEVESTAEKGTTFEVFLSSLT
ncbi:MULTISPECIES: sensor histidine kinase [Pseudomonas]|uniref:histidine kinase n=1 Tax=Pseudomonas putida TaxID=303 RepID=A0A2S3X4M7_PSEPU|nr:MULTISPECIES: HAMP domain-containing sensor histidine kinase [Pseudomonas]PTC01441.1 sensor histidine kinase [Thalassospira xiamenensis]MCE0881770.1 HAMP domain-containing histidine kinase [Pseudomonas putida]MCE0967025.1 HAMP domain-containing histidine kinase [Pseudomonas sp. NMI4491_12]MDN5520401.1 HAMP domain-containing histidine kinase [Pseudomonas sp.]MDO1494484.1 HAMP domain-containing histidine kinase [Pseudomonas putida]